MLNGFLYNDYYSGPAGADYCDSAGGPAGYYLRLGLPQQQVLTGCELIRV